MTDDPLPTPTPEPDSETAPVQPELALPGLTPGQKELAKHGKFTGERLRAENPEVAAWIVELWADGLGLSLRDIEAKVGGISKNTIMAHLKFMGVASVETMRENIGMKAGHVANALLDRTLELAPTMPAGNVAMAMKLAADVQSIYTGNATAIVEHHHEGVVTVEVHNANQEQRRAEARAKLARRRAAAVEVDSAVVPVPGAVAAPGSDGAAGMGLEGREVLALGAGRELGRVPVGVPGEAVDGSSTGAEAVGAGVLRERTPDEATKQGSVGDNHGQEHSN